MPLTGTRDLSTLADTVPLLTSLDTEEWELKGAQHLQLHYELGGDRQALLPPALHPSIPPTLLVNVTHVPDSEVGAFTFATVRVGCRAGARPRGLLVRGYCDSTAAASVLRERWGLPLEVADVQLDPSYARATTSVTVDGTCILAGELVDPQPITGADVQYMATLALARVARDGEETLLLQVDPDYTFDRAQRGRARLTAFAGGGVEPAGRERLAPDLGLAHDDRHDAAAAALPDPSGQGSAERGRAPAPAAAGLRIFGAPRVAHAQDRREHLHSVLATLDARLAELVGCRPRLRTDFDPVPKVPAIYLLSRDGNPVYVGRTRDLRRRLRDHMLPGNDRYTATFAFRLAIEDAKRAGLNVKRKRAELEADPQFQPLFADAKARVSNMRVQYVEVDDPIEQTLLEVYVAESLGTKYNSFETH